MKLQVRVMSGARSGITGVFSQTQVAVGRHRESDLQFDPDGDTDVSVRHAVFLRDADDWFVRDLESRNGTHVNGHRIQHDTKLDDTDQVRFGMDGPRVEIRLVSDATPDEKPAPAAARPARATGSTAAPAAATAHASPPSPPQPAATPAAPRVTSTTQRIRAEVGRQTRKLRGLIGGLVVVLLAVVAYFVVTSRIEEQRRQAEVQAMQARIDSILRASDDAMATLQGQVEGLVTALRSSQTDVQRLQRELETATDAEVETLRRRLATATATFRAQQLAAQVDYRAINDANGNAIAMIWADFGSGDVGSGTAFAVRPDGTMITSRHVVAGEDGSRRPVRLAVQFNNSSQVWPATLLAVDRDVDLAVVRVEGIQGQVPTIQGLAPPTSALEIGQPVAVIGFPLGDDLPMRSSGEANVIRATFTAGTVSKVLPDLLQIDGYGAPGASGSPIFNSAGDVVGVLYGAEEGTSGRVVYSVPVRFVRDLLGFIQ